MLSGWAEERRFMKSVDACCLAQKPSRMSRVRGKPAQCDCSKLVSGAIALLQAFEKTEQEGMVLIVSRTWGCMGGPHQMRETAVIKSGLHSNKTCRALQLALCLLAGLGDGWTVCMLSSQQWSGRHAHSFSQRLCLWVSLNFQMAQRSLCSVPS